VQEDAGVGAEAKRRGCRKAGPAGVRSKLSGSSRAERSCWLQRPTKQSVGTPPLQEMLPQPKSGQETVMCGKEQRGWSQKKKQAEGAGADTLRLRRLRGEADNRLHSAPVRRQKDLSIYLYFTTMH